MTTKPEKRDGDLPLEVDTAVRVDARLADVWGFLWEVESDADSVSEETLAGLLRLAYLTGYQDALVEPTRGKLFVEVGLPVPARLNRERREDPRESRRARRGNSGT
jgi:hypothetical protein